MTDPDPMASLREWAAIFVDADRQTPPAPLADFVDLLARFDAHSERTSWLESQLSRASLIQEGAERQIRELEVERDKLVRTLTLAKVLIQEGREVCAVDEIRATLREIGGDRG